MRVDFGDCCSAIVAPASVMISIRIALGQCATEYTVDVRNPTLCCLFQKPPNTFETRNRSDGGYRCGGGDVRFARSCHSSSGGSSCWRLCCRQRSACRKTHCIEAPTVKTFEDVRPSRRVVGLLHAAATWAQEFLVVDPEVVAGRITAAEEGTVLHFVCVDALGSKVVHAA